MNDQNLNVQGVSPELIEKSMDIDFAAALDETFAEQQPVEGTVAKGIIVGIENDVAIVDIGMKGEGRIPLKEFASPGEEIQLSVGDDVEVFIDSLDDNYGEVRLSREKARREEALTALETAYEKEDTVKGIIFGRVKGGFTVDVSGVLAFLPGSQVDIRPIRDMSPLMNTPLDFQILKLDRKRGNLIVSRRAIMDDSRSEARDELLKDMSEGKQLEGVVKNLTDYGAFIDLGGVDGLLHITDIAWHRINHPSEVLTLGQVVKVQVIRFNEDTKRVSLGLKQLNEDPWKNVEDKFPLGSKTQGRVTNITDYGAFVELDSGVEGLIHVSEMSWTRKNVHPGKLLSTSEEVEVMVLEIDQERRRISLGLKQCQANPWGDYAEKNPVGTIVESTVRSVTDFGIFIALTEEIDGLIHMSDISWDKAGETALRDYKKGDAIKAKILAVDPEKERISLGIKQLEKDSVGDAIDDVKKGDTVNAKVISVNGDGVTVITDNGIESTIKAADLSREREKQDPHNFKEGDSIKAQVVKVSKRDRAVTLSIKAMEIAEEKEAVAAYTGGDQGSATLADALGEALSNKE